MVTAYNGLTPDATPGTYDFTVATTAGSYDINPVSNPTTVTPSSTVAAAHPNLASTINVEGGQPQSLSIQLPKGFNASLNGRSPLCDYYTAFAGGCAATSKIGTLKITADKGLCGGFNTNIVRLARQHIVAQPVFDLVMRIAIDFDNQRPGRTHEIGDVGANHFLPPEFQAIGFKAICGITVQLDIGALALRPEGPE